MMHHSSLWIRSTLTVASAITLSSCVYDAGYYSGPASSYSGYRGGVSTTYSSGGYSSTSLFISTGDPRWGYDPSCYSYYDYTTRCYYDPYLNGYYPYGYRPPVVYGVPHPYGWRPGYRTCPPPRHFRDTRLRNHEHREIAYRSLNEPWSRNVQVQSDTRNDYHRDRNASYQTSSTDASVVPVANRQPSRNRNEYRDGRKPSGSFWSPDTDRSSDRRGSRPSAPPTTRPSIPTISPESQPKAEDALPLTNPGSSARYRQSSESRPSHDSSPPRQSLQGSASPSVEPSLAPVRENRSDHHEVRKPD